MSESRLDPITQALLEVERSWSRPEFLESIFREGMAELSKPRGPAFCSLLSKELRKLHANRRLVPPRLYEFMKPKGTRYHREIDDNMQKALLRLSMRSRSSRRILLKRIENSIARLQELWHVVSQRELRLQPNSDRQIKRSFKGIDPNIVAQLLELPQYVQLRIASAHNEGKSLIPAMIRIINDMTQREAKPPKIDSRQREREKIYARIRAIMREPSFRRYERQVALDEKRRLARLHLDSRQGTG